MTRAVTPRPEREPRSEMSVLGWLVAAGSLLVLLPVLPFVAALGLYNRLTADTTDAVGPDEDLDYEEGEADPRAAA